MKNISLFASIALGLFAGSGIARADVVAINGQLITLECNTGFEAGDLDGWFEAQVFSPTVSWSVSAAQANMGNFSAVIDGNNELRRNFEGFATAINSAGAPTPTMDEVSFSILHPEPGATNVRFTAYYDDGSEAFTNFATNSTDWETFDATMFVNSNGGGAILTGVSVFGNNSGLTFLDDITILGQIPEPGSASLLLLGTLVLVSRRRR